MKNIFKKKKLNKMEADVDEAKLQDQDIEEMKSWSDEDFEDPNKVREQLKKRSKRRKSSDPFVRVDDIERVLAEHGEATDPEKIVSMYMPQRRIRRLGNILVKLDKLKIALLLLLLLIGILFVISFSQEKMGNFTINLDRLELYRKGIAISDTGDFKYPTARLEADVLKNASNITITDLPKNIDDKEGSHNGRNYIAYTYYVRNAGKEPVNYTASIRLTESAKGAEYAARVAVIRNGKRTVYAEPATGGGAEPGTVKFKDHETAYEEVVKDFQVGYVDKYTVVIWLEGEDPQCVDRIIGGALQFDMDIYAEESEEKSLIRKFIEDIKDKLTNNNPINPGGTTAPENGNTNVNWKNRKNK